MLIERRFDWGKLTSSFRSIQCSVFSWKTTPGVLCMEPALVVVYPTRRQ